MIELSLDTTEAKKAKVTITKEGKTIIVLLGESPLPTIHKALLQTKLSLVNIDKFSSNPGPGSFTGVRVGAAVVNALNLALEKDSSLVEPVYE